MCICKKAIPRAAVRPGRCGTTVLSFCIKIRKNTERKQEERVARATPFLSSKEQCGKRCLLLGRGRGMISLTIALNPSPRPMMKTLRMAQDPLAHTLCPLAVDWGLWVFIVHSWVTSTTLLQPLGQSRSDEDRKRVNSGLCLRAQTCSGMRWLSREPPNRQHMQLKIGLYAIGVEPHTFFC